MPKRNDAKLLQVLRRQGRQNRLINVVLAKQRLILSKAQAPQPDHNVHDKRPIVVIMIPSLRESLAWTHFTPTGRLAAATAQGLRLFFKYETKDSLVTAK